MKADYISPYEGTWVPNDFKGTIGEQIVVDDHICTILTVNDEHYDSLVLTVEWDVDRGHDPRVWPNLQWVALNWEDDDE